MTINQITVGSGEIVDSIQFNNNPPLGGIGGSQASFTIAPGDYLASVQVATGTWFGKNVVVQVTFTTGLGVVHGPFGTGVNATLQPSSPLSQSGQQIIGFTAGTQQVAQASGPETYVLTSLTPQFAAV
jgi:Jacalin-like lectin domain